MSQHNEAQFSPRKRRRDSLSAADPKRIKRQQLDPSQPSHHRDAGPSINELKTRIRNIKRLLAKRTDDLPADVRVAKERELAECHRDLERAEERKNRSKMIQKYHFVRFLERKRALKELRKLCAQRSKLDKDTNLDPSSKAAALEKLNKSIKIAETDLNYTLFSPLTEKYISLYPTGRRQQQQGQQEEPPEPEESNIIRTTTGEKPPLWYTVQQSQADGTLEQLRDGKLGIGLSGEKKDPGEREVASRNTALNLVVHRKQKKLVPDSQIEGGVDGQKRPTKVSTRSKGAQGKKGKKLVTREGDEEESGSDGGFFE
ncbi:predicted protein [Uncinocarpus reesii 1704]|uniref:rRNA-processing protein EFG1 n=1 Tax=Uncinocarpus reesii (strain UAMH 1704) TaxID=336963 RepID=C4JK44_UNCRE|nr:uncharacterized protein UREG_02001 [Uncinocarpus reesii 1704]EEP77152.1 predicted protein [Uncinocarpus reesii 1704]